MSGNILVTTMGTTWQVVPELLGFTNPELGYYAHHKENQQIDDLRRDYDIQPVSEVWVISTDGRPTSGAIKRLLSWHTNHGGSVKLGVYQLEGVEELAAVEECRLMADHIYRVVLAASEQAGRLYLSLAGGRKTMSADMQQAGSLFGCAAMLHVVDRQVAADAIRQQMREFDFGKPLPPRLASCVMPLVISGGKVRNPVLDAKGKIKAADYPAGGEEISPALWREVERRQKDARYLLFNYAAMLSGKEHGTNFRALYALPPDVIERLKSDSFDYELIKQLPKAELHCHFGGIATPKEMVEIAQANDVEPYAGRIPEFRSFLEGVQRQAKAGDVEALRKLVPDAKALRGKFGIPEPYTVAGVLQQFAGCEDVLERFIFDGVPGKSMGIATYEKLGDLQGSGLLQSEASIRTACRILVRKCEAHNVSYIEVRCSPVNYGRGGLTPQRVVELMMDEFSAATATRFKLIFIASRHGNMSAVYQHIELAEGLLENNSDFRNFFCGFDLAGAEEARRPGELRDAFLPLMERCVRLTIHAGETDTAESIWEAVYHLNADRIGHGLKLAQKPDLMRRFLDRKIAVEMCPSSNDQIVGFDAGTYPLSDYLENGIKVCVNSDNPGMSRTDFSSEYIKADELCGRRLSVWDVLQLIRNSFQAAFAGFEERRKLMLETEDRIKEIITERYLQ